jgi:FMN phosphatase YigB (HAD superfamily)
MTTTPFDEIDAVLFDIGSTLVAGPAVSPTQELAQAFGLDAAAAKALTRLLMCGSFDRPEDVFAAATRVGLVAGDEPLETIARVWRAQETAAVPIPGAEATVDAFLAAGKKVGLLSDIWAPYFRAVETVLPRVVERTVPFLSFRCGVKKPDTNFFSAATAGLGVRAARTLMVGDSYTEDILPAHTQGMKTAWIVSRPGQEAGHLLNVLTGRAPAPTWVLASITDLVPAVRRTLEPSS